MSRFDQINIDDFKIASLSIVYNKLKEGACLSSRAIIYCWKNKLYDIIKLAYQNNLYLQIHDKEWNRYSLLKNSICHNHKELFRFAVSNYFVNGMRLNKADVIRNCFKEIIKQKRFSIADFFVFDYDWTYTAYMEGNTFYSEFMKYKEECIYQIKQEAFNAIKYELLEKALHPNRIEQWCLEYDSFFLTNH